MKNLFTFNLKWLVMSMLLCIGSSAWATDYSYTFTAKVWEAAGAQTLNEVSWTMAGTGGSYFGYDAGKGQQFGSSNKPYSALSLTTSGISGTITSIAVNTSGANDIAGTVAVSVGGTAFQCNKSNTVSLTSTATTYTFTNTGASGDIVISWAQTSSKAIYVKSITVTYSSGGGSSDPSISLGSTSVDAPETAVSTTTINVTYNNLTNYDADVIFYESDGATAATYDHSWLTAEINASTKNLDYSITANTGAARTAYFRVYALGDEGDAESSLITITQAAKTVTKPEFNLDGGSYMQGTNITISSTGNTVYYNLTTDGSAPATPTNASTEYTAPIVLGSGTTKITAIAYDTYGNASSTTTRTYTGIALASLPFSWTGTSSAGKSDLDNQTGVELSLASDYAASNAPYRLKFDGTTKHITIYTDAKPENVYFTAKLFNNASTGPKIKIQGSTDGISFTDIEEFTIKGSANDTFEFSTSNAFAATHRAVKLVMSSKDQNVAVGTICINCIPVTISAAKYATYVNGNYDLSFDGTNVTAYVVSEDAASSVTLTTVTEAPKNTPLIIKSAAAGIYNVNCIENAAAVGTNLLQVSHGNVTSDGSLYALAQEGGVVGFHQVADGVTIPEGKCYLESSNAVKSFLGFNVDDDATGISEIQGSNSKVNGSGIYTISGQRVNTMTRGLYIVNGKKVIIK